MTQANDFAIEPIFYNFKFGEPSSEVSYYVSCGTDEGFEFQGFVDQNAENGEDEIINVVDVGEVNQTSSIKTEEVNKSDAQVEQSIQ